MCTGAMKICRQLQVTCCDHARPQQDKRNRQWLSKYWQSMYAGYPGFHRLIGGCFLNCHSKRGRHQGSRGWTVEARKNNQYEFLVSILTGFKCCPVLWCLISYVVRIKCTPASAYLRFIGFAPSSTSSTFREIRPYTSIQELWGIQSHT